MFNGPAPEVGQAKAIADLAASPAPEPAQHKYFWYRAGNEVRKIPESEVQAIVDRENEDIFLLEEGTATWKRASEFGFVVPTVEEEMLTDADSLTEVEETFEPYPDEHLVKLAKAHKIPYKGKSRVELIRALIAASVSPE